MRKVHFLLALTLFFILCIDAYSDVTPNAAEAKKQINQIKLSGDYLCAESTNAKWQQAYDDACTLLSVNVEEWAKTQEGLKNVEGLVLCAKNHMLHIQSQRGELYRAFVYVRKTDMMPYTDASTLVVVPMQQQTQTAVAQGPQNSAPVVPPILTQTDTTGTAIVSLPVPEVQAEAVAQRSPFVNDMLEVRNMADIRQYMSAHNIGADRYGKLASLAAVSGEVYMFIYTRQNTIAACLLRKSDGSYVNLRTNTSDDINNYKGCGAIWFRQN